VEQLLQQPRIVGAITMETVSWQDTLALAAVSVPDGISSEDLGSFDLASEFVYEGDSLKLLNPRLQTLGLSADGTATLSSAESSAS